MKKLKSAALIIGALLLLIAGTVAVSLLGYTFVNPWIFIGIVVLAGAATGSVAHRVWSKLTGTNKFYINFPLHLVAFTVLVSAMILTVNYAAADFDNLPREKVIVNKRLTKTRYHTKRITTRRYTRGEPYKAYYLKLTLADKSLKEIPVRKDIYDNAHEGDTATVAIGRGPLLLTVIAPGSLKLQQKMKKKRTSRCKFFGTSGR